MKVGDGGISNTVEVRGFSKKTSQELMEMYFENSRRSGGGNLEEVKIRDEVAYITFKEAEVAQRVASRSSHQVDGHTLTVTLFHPLPPKPCYRNRVLLKGLNNAVTEELLRNFLESKTKAQVTEFLYGEKDRNVVVTFSNNIDIAQLGKIFQESRIEGLFLNVERVAISNCILVQNLQPSSSHDAILYYFENERRSGGGNVERVEMNTEERYCLIYFEDPSVIDRVLGRQSHNADGVDFEIHLHHECLGRRSSRNKSDLYLRMSSPGNKDRATLENTDNQVKETTSNSFSCNPEKDSDFVEVQEWQANDDKATLENTDNQVKEKTSSSVSSDPEQYSDFVEVQQWQENDGKNCTLALWIKYKRAQDNKIMKCMKNIPCSWNFHLYWNFYTKTEPGKQMLHEILNKYNCSVAVFAEDEDCFLFEISEQIFEQESDVVQLIHVVLDCVHKCAQQVLYLDNILVDQRIQGDALLVVRQRKELNIARFELMGQQDFDALYVICTEKDHTLVLHVVTEIIHKVKECFENHEETIHVDHNWQKVMKTFGYLQKLCEKYPSVTISDKTETAIILKGPRDQSKPAADLFLELLGTASSEVQEEIFSPGCQFEIFSYPEMCGYIDIITKECSIVWIPNHQTNKIHLFTKKSEKIKGVDKLIRGCVQERLYPLAKDQTVVSTNMFRSLEELKKMHTGKMAFSSSDKGLILTATDDIFESIDDAMQEIICKETGKVQHSEKPDQEIISLRMQYKPLHHSEINIDKNIFILTGLSGVDAASCAPQYNRPVNRTVQHTKSPLKEIKSSMKQIVLATVTKHLSSQVANFLSNTIKESSSFPASVLPLGKDAAGHTKSSSIPTAETKTDGMSSEREVKDGDGMFYYQNEKTTIKLVSDNICDIVTDALVSIEDANGSGNGQIAKALLAAAGSRYQDVEHSKVKMAKRSVTEVVVTGSGRLKCEFVLHAIAPEWSIETTRENRSFRKNVEKTMMNIMDAAFEKNLKCIAVPLIGIFTDGMSEAPLTICCEAMIAGLDMWIQSHSKEYQFKEVILTCSNPVASKCFANLLSIKRKQDIKGGRSTRGISLTSSESKSDASIISLSSIQSKENCGICKESITDPKVLPKCGHTFCKKCIDQQFIYKPACPCCGVVYGKITGSQPNGTMQVLYEKYSLPGFEGCSTIVIFYQFAGGIQKAEHPHPGRPYYGIKCKAYLPDNTKGKLVLKLLREAFNRRLVFTIGTSRTTGLEDTVTWDDIHHKTSRDGGPQKFGYPDPAYLDRVMEELAVKGVTEESL
ncbi:hypothetical protein ACJMK2_006853 [Sinanodonta woodiana]|uniref:RING-type E3 ubiquitin transferase n=1 Tax=Sinanodonta woodiana TaxID=1069815 RepID=A0ABD3VX88_SINWO